MNIYILNDGYTTFMRSELEIRERAKSLSQSISLPAIDDAIRFLTEEMDEKVFKLDNSKEDILYYGYEVA